MYSERKVEEDISAVNLTAVSRERVKKKLLTGHVLMSKIAATKKENPKRKRKALHGIVSEKLAKKSRKLNEISRQTGLLQKPGARLGSRKTGVSAQYFNTDRSKAVLLLWFLIVTCFCCLYLYYGSAIMLVTYFSKF